MTLADATVTFNAKDQIGEQFDARRTKIWISTNVPDETIIDTDSGTIRLGSGNVLIDEMGNVSVTVWIPGVDSNPSSWQTYIHVDYPDKNAATGRNTRDFGPYTITEDSTLAALVEQQEIPPTYLSQVTALLDEKVSDASVVLDGKIDQAASAVAAAASFATAASQSAADASDISNISIPDDVTEALIKGTANAGPLTRAALGRAKPAAGVAATDVANLTSILGASSLARAESGTYLVTKEGVTVPANKGLEVGAGAIVKTADGALSGQTGGVFRAVTLNSGSRFSGKVDGNRAAQSKTAYNAAGGNSGGVYHFGISANGSQATPRVGVWLDAEVSNVVDYPVHFSWVNDSYLKVRVRSSGGPVFLFNCRNIYVDIEVLDADNDGWKVFPHAVDMTNCVGIRGRIVIRNQFGNGGVSDGTALSSYVSGYTAVDCEDIDFDILDVQASTNSSQSPSVGVSLLGVRNMNVSNLRIVGQSDVLMELGGVVDSTFCNIDLDGRYAVGTRDGYTSIGRGVALYNNALRGDYTGRTREYTRNVRFIGGRLKRCAGHAVDLWDAISTHWTGVAITGSQVGVYSKLTSLATLEYGQGVAIAAGGALRDHRFVDCDISYNERSGAEVYDMGQTSFIGCRAYNNGQAKTFGGVRSSAPNGTNAADATPAGFAFRTSTDKSGVRFVDPDTDDTQTFTAPAFLDPNRPSIIAVDRPERYGEGQTIVISGAGAAGADLKARIDDITHDELTLSTPILTFPTVAGTGTISTTSTSITGTGTAFTTQFVGRAYITVGGQSRRIGKVSDATHAVLDSAFTSNASGAAFTIIQATITGQPSQSYGLSFAADTLSPLIMGGTTPTGHTSGHISDSTVAATKLRMIGVAGQDTRLTDTLRVPSVVADGDVQARSRSVLTLPERGAYKSGWYITPAGSAGTAIPPEAVVHYSPIIISKATTLDRLIVEVTVVGTAGAVIRVGLFDSTLDGLPGALLLDAGTVSGVAVARASLTISQAVPAGVLWTAAVVQGGAGTRPTMRTVSNAVGQMIASSDAAVTNGYPGFQQSAVTGALPATATISDGSGAPIRVSARFA